MSDSGKEIEQQLRKYCNNERDFRHVVDLFRAESQQKQLLQRQLRALEHAIRGDYDSILIMNKPTGQGLAQILYANEALTKLTGYTKKELIGGHAHSLFEPDSENLMLKKMKNRLETGHSFWANSRVKRKNGEIILVMLDAHPLINDDGEITNWVIYMQRADGGKMEMHKPDTKTRHKSGKLFTDGQEAIYALLALKDEFRMVFIKNESGGIMCNYVSEEVENITGHSSIKLLGTGIFEIMNEDDVVQVHQALRQAFKGRSAAIHCRYHSADGREVSVIQSFESGERPSSPQTVQSIALVNTVH